MNNKKKSELLGNGMITPNYRTKRIYFDNRTGQISNSLFEMKGEKKIYKEALYLFLLIGYVPGNATLFENIECLPSSCEITVKKNKWEVNKRNYLKDKIDKVKYEKLSEEELIKAGGEKFLFSVDKLFKPNHTHVVPLSGGFDSRSILAALMEMTEAKNIITYTFGTPNTFDYEIGKKVGEYFGTKHSQYDLTKISLDQEKLISTARLTDGNTDIMQPALISEVIENFGSSAVYWSGFTGDGLGGGHYHPNSIDNINEAIKKLIDNEYFGLISRENEQSFYHLIASDSIYKGVMNLEEEIFFVNHVERYTVSQLFFNKYNYVNPFMEDTFVHFILGINPKYRYKKYLFDKIMKNRFPTFFEIPTKTELTQKLYFRIYNKILKRFLFIPFTGKSTNYIDFQKYFKKQYKALVLSSFEDLENRGIFDEFGIDKENIIKEHFYNRRDNSRKISSLISLNSIINTYCS